MINSQVHLREYTPDDLEAICRIDESCFAPVFRFARDSMRQFAESARAFVPVAEVDGEIAGFAILHVQGVAAYIVTLDVEEAFRRKGLAQGLMQRIEAHARDAGCVVIALHVFERNAAAISFYDHAGFEHVGDEENFYGEGVHALVYRRML